MTYFVIFMLKSKEETKMLWFKKTDPICGMKQEKGKGMEKGGNWFCSNSCLNKHEKQLKGQKKSPGGCCG